MLKINYNENVVSISNSFLKKYNVKPFHSSLECIDNLLEENYQNVVFMIIDGMGASLLNSHLLKNSFLRKNVICNLDTVFPPTTAAATTAIHSGKHPIETGWIGWMCYFPQYNRIIESLRNIDFYTGEKLLTPSPEEEILKYESIYELIKNKNPDLEFYKIFPSFAVDGVDSFSEMCEKILNKLNKSSKSKFISAYWTEPDHSTHKYGVKSNEVKNILLDIEKNLEFLYQEMKDTLVIITADHGAVDVKEIYLNKYVDLCGLFSRPPSLEARFVTFHIKKNMHLDFVKLFKKYFDNDFVLYTKEEFLNMKLLGEGQKHSQVDLSLGDFVAISISDKSLRYSTGEREFSSLYSDHAGFSEEEIKVPLIVLSKK
jgi:hypothetical protein